MINKLNVTKRKIQGKDIQYCIKEGRNDRMLKSFSKEEKSWMLYDCANSAYVAIVMTTILPLFFKYIAKNSGLENNLADSYWGYSTSFATLLVAAIAPVLGSIGDYENMKLKLLKGFLSIGLIATAALFFANDWEHILTAYIASMIGYLGANLFYDGLIVDVSSSEKMDKVSTYGYALGYIGGSIPPIAAILVYFAIGANEEGMNLIAPYVFLGTAVWWMLLSIPMFRNVKQIYSKERDRSFNIIKDSFQSLYTTFKNIKQYKHIFLFLLAYFFYIDGVNTIIHMAVVYGDSMGIPDMTLFVALLTTQVIAFPATILYGYLAKRFGSGKLIAIGIAVYVVICLLAFGLDTELDFWVISILVATSQGGLQGLSRSHFGKMIPKDKSNEFFGFYDIFGKFSAIMGPALFGLFGQLTGKSQYGVLGILMLFIAGGGIFLYLFITERRQKKTI